ncbi:DUF2512 family protein [Paenibacillus sp. YYML68]|uniref:DUF2512 family protein n=1 Tax=Paenibacillus sp. YYML68 TaxID=2909250 RepID=UPI002490D7FC|nr:DUF2512 family protein [Paenibacillus sp. YYML68]
MFQRISLKLLLNAALLIPLLYLFSDATFWQMVGTSVGLSVLGYAAVDQWVLRRSGNVVATVTDAGLTALYLLLVSRYVGWSMSAWGIVITSLVIGALEYMYHVILIRWDKRSNAFSYRDIQ